MLDSKQREAELLRARERLARAFAQLEAIVGAIPERIRLLESSRDKSNLRILEIEELLERERAITEQRQSLSEGTTEQLHALTSKLEKAEKGIADRDKKLSEFDERLNRQDDELRAHEKTYTDVLERNEQLAAAVERLQDENEGIERQLELVKEEREHLQKELSEVASKANSYALMFTQDERLGLIKTVDALIEQVDAMAGHHGELTK